MNAEAQAPAPAPDALPDAPLVKPLKSKQRRRFALLAFAVLLIGCFLLRDKILWGAGRLLTSAGEPVKADIVVVLGGDVRGNRVLKAVDLFREGYAPRIMVSGMANLYGFSESDRAIDFAVRHGAPAGIFVPQRDDVTSTVEEAAFDIAALRNLQVHSLLLVTSAYHTRRAGRIFHRMAPEITVQTVAAPDPYWNNGYWWKSREGCKLWLYEAMKSVADLFRI